MQLQTFVGRNDALATLTGLWAEVTAGAPRVIMLEGAEGVGRQTLVSELLKTAESPVIPVRISFMEGEDGLQVLLRLYASIYTALHQEESLKEQVKALLQGQLEGAPEVRAMWIQAFLEGMDKPKPDTAAASYPVTLPRHSPFLAFQELVALLSPQFPVLLELGNTDRVHSFTFWTFLLSFLERARAQKLRVLTVFVASPLTAEDREAAAFLPRAQLMESPPPELPVTTLALAPMSDEDLKAVLEAALPNHRIPAPVVSTLLELSAGLPGRLAELVDLLKTRELLALADDESWTYTGDAEDLSMEELVPSIPAEHEGLARQALQVAALEGQVFTAALIRDHLDVDKDTIDDLMDELDELVEEVVHHQNLQSWLYRFKSPAIRRYFAGTLDETARKELSRALGELIEKRYMSRSVDYAYKAARLWKDVGDARRARSLVSLAASSERPDMLQMAAEIMHHFPGVDFPPALFKGVHMTLLEKVDPRTPPEPVLKMVDDVEKWAEEHKEKDLLPWLAFHRGRVLHRSGNQKDALTWAEKAQKGFASTQNPVKEADAFNLMALIALSKGDLAMANEQAGRASRKSDFAPVKAQTQFIRGVVHKGKAELQPAINLLKEALELSARTNQLPLHLDSGLNIAECLLMGGKAEEAANLLSQLTDVSKQANQPGHLHGALALLAKAEATRQDPQKAIEYASQALQLARELKIRPLEAADLLDLGIFSFVRGQLDEAGVYLRESEKIARELKNARLLKEVLFHHAMVCTSLKDYSRALKHYQEGLKLAKDMQDTRREANILFNIGEIYRHQEEYARARTYLDQAAPLLEKVGTPEEQRALKKAKELLELKIN